MVILLDPGHGGLTEDGRYTTAPNKMFNFPNGEVAYEGVINRELVTLLQAYLQDHGFRVPLVVDVCDPTDVPLKNRVRMVNKFLPSDTILVSIHSNASPSHTARGFEVFSTVGVTKSDKLAKRIVQSTGGVVELHGSKNRGVKEANFYIIKNTKCPAVLVEVLFFDNPQDFALLKNKQFLVEVTEAIGEGIINYTNEDK